MDYHSILETAAAAVALLMAGVAAWGYRTRRRKKVELRSRLERHLKKEKEMDYDQGQRTVTHLIAQLGMTEAEVLEAAFNSQVVRRVTAVDDQGRAKILMFEYDDGDDLGQIRHKRARF